VSNTSKKKKNLIHHPPKSRSDLCVVRACMHAYAQFWKLLCKHMAFFIHILWYTSILTGFVLFTTHIQISAVSYWIQ